MKKLLIAVILFLAILSLTACNKEKPGRYSSSDTIPVSSVI